MTSDPSDGTDAGGSSSGVSVSAGLGPPRGVGRNLARPALPVPEWLRGPEWLRVPERLRGPWRVAVAEESMAPALRGGDWLLIDPTIRRWPRRGSVVVFREPDSDLLAVKRVAGGPGDRVRISAGVLHLGPGQAWLLGDNEAVSIDSRRYGPVDADAIVGRAWFRYAPPGRIGPLRRRGPGRA